MCAIYFHIATSMLSTNIDRISAISDELESGLNLHSKLFITLYADDNVLI